MKARKDLSKLVLISSAALTISSAAWATDSIVPVSASRLYVPTGFDDNDDIEVVVEGNLPSTCHKITDGRVSVDPETKEVIVFPMAKVIESMCLQVLVPYTTVIKVGVLAHGQYKIKSFDGQAVKTLPVRESNSSGPDDYLYVPVDRVTVDFRENEDMYVARITGRYTNTCMHWVETKVIHNANDVIEILPIMKLFGENCEEREFAFKGVTQALPKLEKGRYLIHVRGLSGKSLNHVFSVPLEE